MMSITLNQIEQVNHGGGKNIVIAPDSTRWICSWSNKIFLWEGTILQQTLPSHNINSGRAVFGSDGKLYIGSQTYDFNTQVTDTVQMAKDTLSTGLDGSPQFGVSSSVWTADAAKWIVYADYRYRDTKFGLLDNKDVHSRLLILDGQTQTYQRTLAESPASLEYSILAASEQMVIAGGLDTLVYNLQSGDVSAELKVHELKILDACFSFDMTQALTADWSGKVVLWDTANWEPVAVWNAHPDGSYALAFHPVQNLIATGGADNQVKVWDIDDEPTVIASLDLQATAIGVGFQHLGDRLTCTDELGNVYFARID